MLNKNILLTMARKFDLTIVACLPTEIFIKYLFQEISRESHVKIAVPNKT